MTKFYLKQYGNVFEARLSVDDPSNAWQGSVILPADLNVKSVVYGESIGDVWQNPPSFHDHKIFFAGGRTNPWTGDGLLFRFTIEPKNSKNYSKTEELIRFDSAGTAAYAADGKGSELLSSLQPITINTKDLLSATTSLPSTPGNVPPEPFEIMAVQDPHIFDGKLSVIFSTRDSGVGIDHYEAREYTKNGIIDWHIAQSPYLVDPETFKISIRAIDRNGNFRIEDIVLRENFQTGIVALIVGGLFLACLVAVYFIKRWRAKK